MEPFPQFDVNYVAKVLGEIWGREHGFQVKVTLTPKESATSSQQEEGG